MQLAQACRVVVSVFLLAGGAAQAQESTQNEVLLAPGKFLRVFDAANPGLNVIITAPEDAYVNLSRLFAASEKVGILAAITALQTRPAGNIVLNLNGTLSLEPTPDGSYFVLKDSPADSRRITVEGGTAIFDRGRTHFQSDTIIRPAPPATAPR
jgi:hypothetical protein